MSAFVTLLKRDITLGIRDGAATGTAPSPASSSIVNRTIMIWPPNRSWYATLSMATWSSAFR